MGHADHAHGRVFRGLKKDTQKMVPHSKRSSDYSENVHRFIHRRQDDAPRHNTNGDRIKMNVPEGFPKQAETVSDRTGSQFAQKAQADDVGGDSDVAVETVFAQVFTTLDQTFDGPPQFFSTQKIEPTSTRATQPAVQTTAAADNSRQQNTNGDDDQTPSRRPVSQATSTSAAAPTQPTTSAAAQHSTASTEDDNATSTQSAIHVTSSSIVTGDISSTRGAQVADHTSSMIRGTPVSATHSSSATAEPEQTGMTSGAKAGLAVGIILGLGLVFGLIFFCWRRKKNQRELEEHNEKSASAAPVPVNRFSSDSEKLRRTSTQTSATAPRLSLRPVTQFLPNLTASGNEQNNAQNPFGDAAVVSDKAAGHDRANSVNSDSNASVESAVVAAAPGSAQVATAAAVPVNRGPNNVHRVQLEFKPSMDDELELKSGQLVRMLHEYDDGWALCATMDRSKKGVVPRTCLSKMPVKPRGPPPQNGRPPVGPNNLPTPPPGANVPRPLTPTQQGQQAQQGRPRAPTLDGVPARKPVPGQAL